jgi:hypothetical protein
MFSYPHKLTPEETRLINAIKKLEHHHVRLSQGNASAMIAISKNNSVKLLSIWLGRNATIANLQNVLNPNNP